jgi:hypothetical protein
MTSLFYGLIAGLGLILLIITTMSTYSARGRTDDFPQRVLCLLTIAVLLILYGFGVPR